MTKREERISIARELFANPPTDEVGQAEAANYLKDEIKLSRHEIADVLGITAREVLTRLAEFKNYVAKKLIPTGNLPVRDEDPLKAALSDEQERVKRGALNIETKQLIEGQAFEQRFAQAVAKHVPSKTDLRHIDELYKDLKKGRAKSKGGEEAAVAVISDAHFGLANPYFDYQVARDAVKGFMRKVVKLTELHRTQCDVRTLYLNLNGDNVQGSSGNFPAQRWTVLDTAVDQAEVLTEVSVECINEALLNYDKVVVVCRRGNHGNLYPRKTSVEPDHANIETVVHRTLRWIYKGNPRVEVQINDEEWYSVVNLMGVRALFTHGDAIPGAGSFDGVLNSFRKFNDILPAHDIAVIGHFHRLARLPMPTPYGSTKPRTLYMNGTAVKGDTHGEQFGAAHSNSWWTLFVNHERVTAEYAVSLYD